MAERTDPPAEDEDPVAAAIDRRIDAAVVASPARILLFGQAHRWEVGMSADVDAIPGDRASLMLMDPERSAWRAIVLPDGTRWSFTCTGRSDGLVVPV